MRIALCTPTMNTVSGANTGQAHLARQLRALGHDVTRWSIARTADEHVFCVRRGLSPNAEGEFSLDPNRDFVQWEHMWDEHDVVHITNCGALYLGYRDLIELDKKGGPLFISIHDPHELDLNFLGPTLMQLCRIADGIGFIGRRFFHYFREAEYISRPMFDDKAFLTPQPYVRIAKGRTFDKDPKRVVCTSGWRWNKRIDLAVKAAVILVREHGFRPVEFWTGHRIGDVEAQAFGTPGWDECCVLHDAWKWPEDAERIYGSAGVVLNLTEFNETDTGRTEYPVLEAWDFHCVPVLNRNFYGPDQYLIGRDVRGGPKGEPEEDWNCVVTREPTVEAVVEATVLAARIEAPDLTAPSVFMQSLVLHEHAGELFVERYEKAANGWGAHN